MTTSRNTGDTTVGVSVCPEQIPTKCIAQTIGEALNAAIMSLNQQSKVLTADHSVSAKAMDNVDDDQDRSLEKTHVCRICGNTIAGRLPKQCPVCGASQEEFDEAQ